MLVSELRALLKKYNEEDLRLLISEMYKAMPKKLREEKEIDALLQDVHLQLRLKRVDRVRNRQIDINDLKPDIEQFIDFAYNQYYFAPNNFIHKKERPKWRFKVKAYIKSLQEVPLEGEEGRTATALLEKLYEMLCYACAYYIFSTEDPFKSVGIEQTTLLDIVIKRKLGHGINKESVKSVLALVINSTADRETLPSFLINVMMENLQYPDSKEIAIEQGMALKAELERKKANPSKESCFSSHSDYEREEKINNLVETVFRLYIELCEYEKGIKYFKNNNIKRNSEVSLFILLELLFEYDLKEYWLNEYDEAVEKGVKPRESLQRTYNYIKENDELPDCFLC
jgi:hypothetical protein